MARGAGPARKKSLNPGESEDGRPEWDWDKESTPMVPKGKEPKFIKPSDKFSSTEGENVFCTIDIVGDPVPTVTWFKASKDLTTEPRCKQWTSAPNQAILGFSKTKQDDEGEYRVEIENEHGMVEHTFSLYVTVAGAHLDIPFYDRIKHLQRTNPAMVCQIISRLANDLRAKSIYDSRQQNLRTLESQFGNELYLAHPEREYTLKGKLKKVNRSGKSTDYTFFLFNDVIIYAQRTGNDKFKVHRTLQLGLVEVRDGQLKRYEHVFILVSPQKTLHLVAESEKEKQTWMEHIRKNIWKLDEDRISWSKDNAHNSANQQLQIPRSREQSLFIGRKPEFKTFELKRAEELEQTKGRRSARYRSSSRRGGSWEMESLVRDSNISTISNRFSAINFTDLKTLKRDQPCKLCLKPFTLFRRSYSCPWCQDIVCMNCVMKERIVLPFENKPGIPQREQRVCEACGYYIQHEELNKLGGVI